MMKFKITRKKLFVDKKFQTKFIFSILIFFIAIIFVLSIFLIYSTSNELKGSVYSKLMNIKNTQQIIMPVVIKISILVFIFGGSIALYNLLKYSNQIVGPMVRFKRYLKRLGEGDFTISLTFRKNDELQDLANLLTKSSKSLNKRATSLKKHFYAIKNLVKEKGIKRINNKEIKILEEAVDTIDFILKDFKTN